MIAESHDERILTGVRNLDDVLGGGIPIGSITVLAGSPGSGKTILSQQIAFHNAAPTNRVLFFQTLSEPTAKTLRYLKKFKFFDQKKLEDGSIEFIDLGGILREEGLSNAINLLMDHVKRFKPSFVIIDSFKVFSDLAKSHEELRKFSYEVAIKLMGWECTTFLLGEFAPMDLETNPLFSIADGIISLNHRAKSGEEQRFIQIIKMRGTNHSRDEHTFLISDTGLDVFAPRVTIKRKPFLDLHIKGNGPVRARVGISKLDSLMGEGIPYGSSILVSGAAGTGKTLLLLEFIYKGATEFHEKGIFFSFEETTERLITNAKSMGWNIEREIEKGNIEIVFIAQTDILVEKNLLMIKEKVETMKAKRVAIDSASIFVHKVSDPQIVREKIFQLGSIIQNSQAIGLFSSDIPHGSNAISRFGVEETMVDGVILLSSIEKGLSRERSIEIYKLRNTSHLDGKHKIQIKKGGIMVQKNPASVKTAKMNTNHPENEDSFNLKMENRQRHRRDKDENGTPFTWQEHAYERLKVLYGVGKLLSSEDNIEKAFPAILSLCTSTFPFVTGIIIENHSDKIRTLVWNAKNATKEQKESAINHAKEYFIYLTAASASGSENLRMSPTQSEELNIEQDSLSDEKDNFCVLPLLVDQLPAFGILQLEGALPLTEKDVEFVGALADLISVSVDRHHKSRFEREQRKNKEDELSLSETHVADLESERELREKFVSLLTHDLRTPLTTIKMTAQLIKRHYKDPDAVLNYAVKINNSVKRADQMIINLLDANRIRSGEILPLKIEAVDLNKLVKETIDELSVVHGDRFVLKTDKTIIGFWDPKGIRRIIENLCNNAIKYGSSESPVSLVVKKNSKNATIEVQNFGNIIPSEDLKFLFQQFRRGRETTVKGWGIGLTLVRGVAEAHGGSASVESDAETGTVFTVRLPLDARNFS